MSYGDGSLQQFSELWGSSRYRDGVPQEREKSGKELRETEDAEDDKNLLLDDTVSIGLGTPSWLSNALLRQQAQPCSASRDDQNAKWCTSGSLANTMQSSSACLASHPYNNWLSAIPMSAGHHGDHDSAQLAQDVHGSTTSGHAGNLDVSSPDQMGESSRSRRNAQHNNVVLGLNMESAGGCENPREDHDKSQAERLKCWQEARLKARVLSHPLFSQMLAAHVGCLRIATPVDHLPKIDEQLALSQAVIEKYSAFAPHELHGDVESDKELDDFMRHYTMLLMTFQDQLQHHVKVHATEAMAQCYKIEQRLRSLTGVGAGPGIGLTMSDEEEEEAGESEVDLDYENSNGVDLQDSGGYGPLVPTETERSLMERVKQELKSTLHDGYRAKIVDVREEILRKRRAGKLPEGTTTVLKSWWDAHSKWPYPTEDEKERLIQETGLELKQVNNWFINQRKRNWHSNPLSSSSELKNKRKGWELYHL